MRVFLAQHAEAHPKERDPERRLTERGLADARRTAAMLKGAALSVEQIWHSGKPRTQQTAEILAAAMTVHGGIGPRDELGPDDPVRPIHHAIEHARGDLFIVGHMPFLARLAAEMLVGDEKREVVAFEPGSVACLEQVAPRRWRLAWMTVPRLAPELS